MSSIESVMTETRVFEPAEAFKAQANVKGMEGYRALCEQADKDYEGFWAGLAKELLELSDMLDETCRQARQLDSQRQIQLDAPAGLKILGDRDAMKQVTLIALDNALKHSTGDIHITAQKQGAQVEVRVQDFGEGIPPEKLEHVFDRFYRGDDASTIPGFGLGLSIAKILVEGMDGEIKMESEVGEGSVVILRFAGSNAS